MIWTGQGWKQVPDFNISFSRVPIFSLSGSWLHFTDAVVALRNTFAGNIHFETVLDLFIGNGYNSSFDQMRPADKDSLAANSSSQDIHVWRVLFR